jgi:hypothetical protein
VNCQDLRGADSIPLAIVVNDGQSFNGARGGSVSPGAILLGGIGDRVRKVSGYI